MINRWRWIKAYRADIKRGISDPMVKAEFVARHNDIKFWWMKEMI